MKLHKRRKSTRYRGSKTHRRGFKKKARGSGHRGGFGMSGSENQKKTMVLNLYGNDYFGKDKAIRRPVKIKARVINLDDIERNIPSYIKSGKAKDNKGTFEIKLPQFKILGSGNVTNKLIIHALSASESAVEKVKKAGGSITVLRTAEVEEKAEKPVAVAKPEAKK